VTLDREQRDGRTDLVEGGLVRGLFLLTQALLPQLEAAATADDPARVINIGSVDGLQVPAFDSFACSASKAAVHHLTRHLGQVLAPRHVTVNAIAPGLFPSKMTAFMLDHEDEVGAGLPRGRLGTAEDIAGTAIYLAARAGAYTTGALVAVDGGVATLRRPRRYGRGGSSSRRPAGPGTRMAPELRGGNACGTLARVRRSTAPPVLHLACTPVDTMLGRRTASVPGNQETR
jgi:hypothetical protein